MSRNLAVLLLAFLCCLSLSARAQCTAGSAGTVKICSPAAGSTVSSPVTFQAAASPPSGQTISAMKLYVDDVGVAHQDGASFSSSQNLSTGSHHIVIKAWTTTGTVLSADETITVSGSSCSASAGTVTICSPTPGSTVASPVTFHAVATAPSGQTISAMKLYVDNVGVANQDGADFSSSQILSSGSHSIVIKAWTTTGTVLSAAESITVSGSSCSASAGTVTICSPANGATVDSPVAFQAVAGAPSGQSISAMKLYVDSVGVASQSGGSFSSSQNLSSGSHNITIKAWTTTGTVFQAQETITVSASSGGACTPTASEVTICSPADGATVDSPVAFQAVAGAPSGQTISAMKLYVDSVGVASQSGASFSSSQDLTAGSHNITIKAWTTSGTVLQAQESISVNSGPPTSSGPGVYTYGYNNHRTGANTAETRLTPAAVTNGANFGLKGSWALDAKIYAQPLYAPSVQINGGTYNVLYVATEKDSVYALNADAPGQILWKRSFLTSTATIGTGYTGGRTSIGAAVGITGTPVIDPDTNRLYVLARTTENSEQVQRLHAIDIRTGQDVVPNVALKATVSGTGDGSDANGNLSFDALTANQRPGLLLSNGVIYISTASFGDNDPYHGWLLAYDAGTLQPLAAYNNTPDSGGGGIWMSGAAPAADLDGNVYFTTGNVRPDATGLWDPIRDIPNSVVKVKLIGSELSVVDYFSPYNVKCLSAKDLDLGSSGVLLIPGQFAGHDLTVFSSKEGRVYLTDRNNLGKWHSGDDSQLLDSKLFNPKGACESSTFDASSPWRVYGTPAYWNGYIYFGSAFGPLRQYRITDGTLNLVAIGTYNYPASGQSGRGPITIVSANGTSNGIVWTAQSDLNGNGWLHAYDANDVSHLLYSHKFGTGNSFMAPMVVNGRLYVAGRNTLYMFGLLQ